MKSQQPKCHHYDQRFLFVFLSGLVLTLLLASLTAEADESIRAAYWWIHPLEHAEQQLRLLHEHGFNTALLKDGRQHLRSELWKGWGDLATRYGMQLLAVINFASDSELQTARGRYQPYVDRHGRSHNATPCPLDETYWRLVIEQRLAAMAKLAQSTGIAGVVIDTEMYAGDLRIYSDPCFCDRCWQAFVRKHPHIPGDLTPKARSAYLDEHGLNSQYAEYQQTRLQALLKPIATRIHQIKTDFSLGGMLYRENWFYRGFIRGFGTPEQPVLIFSENSYTRGYTPQILREKRAIYETTGFQHPVARYVPGLWLSRFLPHDLPTQCAHVARHTDGYWIFSARSLWQDQPPGPYALHGPKEEYWAALKQGNETIRSNPPQSLMPPLYATSYYDPEQKRLFTPPSLEKFLRSFEPPMQTDLTLPDGPITYRGTTLLHVLSQPGGTIRVSHVPVARYTDPTNYRLFNKHGQILLSGTLDRHHQSIEIPLDADSSGILSLLTNSGANATRIVTSDTPGVVEASATFPLATINTAATYPVFLAPKNPNLRLRAYCSGKETALLTIRSPDNQIERSTRITGFTEISVPIPPNFHERFWTLAITPVPLTVFEDIKLSFYNTEFPYIVVFRRQ